MVQYFIAARCELGGVFKYNGTADLSALDMLNSKAEKEKLCEFVQITGKSVLFSAYCFLNSSRYSRASLSICLGISSHFRRPCSDGITSGWFSVTYGTTSQQAKAEEHSPAFSIEQAEEIADNVAKISANVYRKNRSEYADLTFRLGNFGRFLGCQTVFDKFKRTLREQSLINDFIIIISLCVNLFEIISKDGKTAAHYVDGYGFEEIPDFSIERTE